MARSPMDMTTRGYDYDYDYDRTEEVLDVAADLVPLTPSAADHAWENEAAFEEYFFSPESDEDGDEDEDEDRDENEDEDEDREAESIEPDSLRFEYFFSSSEDEDEDEDDIEGYGDEEHSIITEARFGPSSAAAHTHGAVLDDDGGGGGVLRNLFRSDDWDLDGIALRGLFRLDSDGETESSDEASVQTDQTTRFRRTVLEGAEYSSSLSLLLDAFSSFSGRRATDRTDIRDQYSRNNSDGDRDDHAVDRSESDRNNNDDDDADGIDGDYFDYDDDDDDDDINLEEFMLGVVPATKSSIEALEEVTTTTTTSAKDQCAICLEDFSTPVQSNGHDYLENENGEDHDHDYDDQNYKVVVVVRMPCSHLYHKECIVQWLKKSHLCPLCRYAMPTFDDTTSDL